MPKVSVIIPVYNVEKYLTKCLNSVINQTLKDIEIVCVNDGSTDNSLKILEEYAQKDRRIKIINQQNKGLGGARNTGLRQVTGEYILFLDSDDWIESAACETMLNKAYEIEADVVLSGETLYFENTNDYGQGWRNFKNYYDIDEITKSNFIETFTPAWARLYKRLFIEKHNLQFVEHCYYEDNSWGCFIAIFAQKVGFVENQFFYRQRNNAITAIKDEKVFDWVEDFKFFYNFIKNKDISSNKLEMAKMWYFINFYNYYYQLSDKNKKIFSNKICKILPLLDVDSNLIKETEVINNEKQKKQLIRFLKFLNSNFVYKYLYSHKNSLQNILSVTNIKTDDFIGKQVKILGIKLKFKNKYKTLLHIVQKELEKLYSTNITIASTDIIPNKIVFNNMTGKGYGCNPKYIAQEIIRQNLPYELVWLVNDIEQVKDEFPKQIRLVEYNPENAVRELANAKIWISNQRLSKPLFDNGLYRKPNQYYIQTWHGWTPIKTIEKDVEKQKPEWCKIAKIDSLYINLLTASSKLDKKRLEQVFYYNGEISDVGLPRNDIFYVSDEEKKSIIQKVREFYNIPSKSSILLYAPTFRDDGRLDAYDIDVIKIQKTLEEKYNKAFTVIARLHPNVIEKAKEVFDFQDYVDGTDYPDVMELLLSSDVMVTDYSCLMFEFMHTRKPVFLFCSDLEKYLEQRKFYFDIKNLIFPFAQTNEELVKNIQDFNYEKYKSDVENFIKESGSKDDGQASKYIVEKIKEVIRN